MIGQEVVLVEELPFGTSSAAVVVVLAEVDRLNGRTVPV
jgi:hypothetical protein